MSRQPRPPKQPSTKPSVASSLAAQDAERVVRGQQETRDAASRVLSAEDASLLRFIEGKGTKIAVVDPLSDEGLRLQALYVQSFSQHPLDVMRRIMENPFSDTKDRMSAAKTIMEYSLRKPTQNLALDAKSIGLSLDASALAGLSDSELTTLEKLLSKAAGATHAN